MPNYNHIAGWDNISFSKLSNGLQGQRAYVLSEYNEQMIAGGGFTYAGDTIAFGVAAWDGQKWFPLDTGLLGTVYTFLVDSINNFLYVGGTIDYAGGNGDLIRIYNIASWDGYKWSAVGNDSLSIFFGGISSLSMYHNYLYAGGYSRTGTIIDTVLTKWYGNSWHRIEGPDNSIECLEVYNDKLYVGGHFHNIIDSLYNHIASYYEPPDTINCLFIQPLIHAMPYGTKEAADTIYTIVPYHLQFYNNNKYATSWSWNFGDGATANTREPEHTYTTPGTYNVTLEVIHPHNLSAQVCTLNVSKTITIIDNTAIKETKTQKTEYLGQNIPNPFTNTTIIPYFVPAGSKGFLQITDTKGELIDEYALQQGHNKLEISMKTYTAGVYLYSIVIDGVVRDSKRMVGE